MRAIGGYRILGELGRGGMGQVYRAHDPRLDRQVALKVVTDLALQPELLARFRREAQAMARLRHPHVVGIHEVGVDQGQAYLVMDVLEGGSLAQRLRQGPLPSAEVARVGAKLARALAHAHARDVLHRDLKPSNVLLDAQGEPALSDFGLARVLDHDGRLTLSGEILGTPAYMAPEQARAHPRVDQAADIYGLGATLYHALTGRPPFEGQDLRVLLEAVARCEPPAPRSLEPGVDPRLEAILLRCLAKRPGLRPASAAELAAALEGLASPAESPPGSRRSWAVAGLSLLAVVALVGLGVTWSALRSARAQAEQARASAREQERLSSAQVADLERRWAEALAGLRAQTGRLDGIQQRLDRSVADDPALTQVVRRFLHTTPMSSDAAQVCGLLHARAPTPWTQVLVAEAMALTGAPEQALRELEQLGEPEPRELQVRARVVESYARFALGDLTRAGQRAQNAAGRDKLPQGSCLEPWEWNNLAQACEFHGAREAAVAVLTRLINLTGDPEAHTRRASLLIERGDHASALADLETSLAQAPDYLPALLLRAELAADGGNARAAQDDLSRARAQLGRHPGPPPSEVLERIAALERRLR